MGGGRNPTRRLQSTPAACSPNSAPVRSRPLEEAPTPVQDETKVGQLSMSLFSLPSLVSSLLALGFKGACIRFRVGVPPDADYL